MSKAVRIHAYGGPEMLRWEDVPLPEPGPGEALIEQKAIGLNYIDVYFRTGLYKVPGFPAVIGQEGAGVVSAVGPGVTTVNVGDRVAYAGPLGAYANNRVIQADRLVKLPDTIDFATAASLMLQGLTAQYLLHRTYKLQPGETILVHAAAGGVGLILCQWARHLGATVIGVVSTEAKAELARQNGANHVIVGYKSLAAEVKRLTGGAMVPVVYDSVGKDTFQASLDCLAPLGLMVSYGSSSGPVPPVDPSMLAAKGSLFLTRPSLATYSAKRADLERMAADLFSVVASGALHAGVHQTFALKDAAAAHTALESRTTTGSTVLVP
jgi:NADPH2:quinone reductase